MEKNKLGRLYFALVQLFFFTVPLSQFLSIRLLLLCAFLMLFNKPNYSTLIKRGWDIMLYLVIILVGLTYSENFLSGISVLETNFSLLAIPLLFSSSRLVHPKIMTKFFGFFILGLLLNCFISLATASFMFYKTGSENGFFFYELTKFLDFQPTYFAYYLVFAITFIIYQLNNSKDGFHPVLLAILALFFFGVLMLTGGRTSFISLLLIFSFFTLRFFLEKRKIEQWTILVLIGFMMTCMFATSVYRNKDRSVILDDSWDRYDLWKSAIDANPNIIFGVGTGDYKSVLNEYFLAHRMEKYAFGNFNSHNQFIQIFLSNGLLGFFAVVLLIGRPLYLSFKNDNTLGILIFFPFMIYGVTEVFLGRYQGIVFYAFLHQVFISHIVSSKPFIHLKN
jgi:O-antigen ligase